MEFDWLNPPFDIKTSFLPREIEEAFEDPFSLRLAPDDKRFVSQARYFCVGKTLEGKGIFSVYRTNGKHTRVISARAFTPEEEHFYERKKQENL